MKVHFLEWSDRVNSALVNKHGGAIDLLLLQIDSTRERLEDIEVIAFLALLKKGDTIRIPKWDELHSSDLPSTLYKNGRNRGRVNNL